MLTEFMPGRSSSGVAVSPPSHQAFSSADPPDITFPCLAQQSDKEHILGGRRHCGRAFDLRDWKWLALHHPWNTDFGECCCRVVYEAFWTAMAYD